MKLRIVLDTNVLVRAHPRSRSNGRKILESLIEGRHTLVLSHAILAETTKVLRDPRLQKLHALTDEQLYDYVQFLQEVSDMVATNQPYHAPMRDIKDLHVVQTAEQGEADALCSSDSDFHTTEIIAYCALRGIAVYGENALLARLGSARTY